MEIIIWFLTLIMSLAMALDNTNETPFINWLCVILSLIGLIMGMR